MKDIKAIIEGIVSQGKFVGSRGHAFRSSSSSDSSGGKHDHGVDIGAERNLAHQMATRQRVDQNTKNREQEMQKRNKEAEQRRKETTKMSKENIDEARRPGDLMGRKGIQDFLRTRDILSGKKPETKAPDSEKKPTQTVTKEETGTEARVKVKNVARPEDAAPNSEKSVLGKQGQIKTKIIDEEKLTMSMPNFGLSKSLIDSVRQIVEKKQDHDGDPKKMNGGKTEVDLDPETNDNMNDDDNAKKKSKSKKNDKDDDDDKKSVKEGKEHTVPKSEKEKKLAALASPKDKITHKDVLVGRGVVKEEEVEELDENLQDWSSKHEKAGNKITKNNKTATYHAFDKNGKHIDSYQASHKMKEESILSQEELDRLDEISKTTLSSYVKKVASTPADKVKKSREKGIETASKKLHEEETDLEEGRGRPRKNPLPPGQETEGDDTHKHPMQQLEKISHSIEGREPHFEHKDDSKSKISRHLARHMVVVHNSMKTTQEKDDFANKLHANRESMRSAMSKNF
jgi:hypothetical protein